MANQQIVVVKVGSENFGMGIEQVKEIISPQQVFKVPETPDYIEGLINIRDSVYTLINLRRKFKLPNKEYDDNTKILVVNSDKYPIALLVDGTKEITWIDDANIDSTPDKIKAYEKKNVTGIINLESGQVLVLDTDQLINSIGE